MERPPASASQSNLDYSPRRFQHATPQASPSLGPNTHPLQRHASLDGPGPQSISLPPLRQLSSTPPTPNSDRRPRNPFGAILNPQAEIIEQQRGLKRTASQIGSPSPSETQHSQSLPPISRPTSVDSTHEDSTPARPFGPPPPRLPARHMGNPRSPTQHRPHQVVFGERTGTIDAHQSPFLGVSVRSDPTTMTSQPALPTPPVGVVRTTYFPPAPTPPPGMVRNELRRPSMSFPQSGSASPIASYSPYSQPASVASSMFEGSAQQHQQQQQQHQHQHQQPFASPHPGSDFNTPMISMETERTMIPMAPTGQSSIQIMTIKSQQGHQVQIPVDVQAASKVADEKRKRNAGASARFRARRKEKEREASLSITRLEQQLRDALEDVDFYRQERDHFRTLAWQHLGGERSHSRAVSPRFRRPSVAPSSTRAGSVSSYGDYEELDHRSPSEPDRSVRRRTSTYHPVPGPPGSSGPPQAQLVQSSIPGPQPQSQPQTPQYAPPSFQHRTPSVPPGSQLHRGPPNQQHFDHRDPRDQRPPSEFLGPSSQGQGFRDPFTPNDNRNWAAGPPTRDDRR